MSSENSLAAGYPGYLNAGPGPLARWSGRAARFALLRLLGNIRHGSLRLTLPDGESHRFQGELDGGPDAEIVIRDQRAISRLLRGGHVGFAESYLERQWDTPDLLDLLLFAVRNESALRSALGGGMAARLMNRLYHRSRNNSRHGSRRNIAFHYDLGNAFYRLWLDDSMTYSAGLFERPGQSLPQAQQAKYRRIAELAGLRPDARVLEIGCGWGGFMEHAASRRGSRVTGITLSREQLAFANRRMALQGLDRMSRASLTDYRDTQGSYDAVVSIEMLEAVGEENWRRYFDILHQRLKPGAPAVVQVITIADERFDEYRRGTDFIQRHVFPGGMLPCPAGLRNLADDAGLVLDHSQTFGLSYARTLAHWRERFLTVWPQVAAQGFDQRFRRLWEYYLCYCEAGFRTGGVDVGIYRFRRPE